MYLNEEEIDLAEAAVENLLENPFVELQDDERETMFEEDIKAHESYLEGMKILHHRLQMFQDDSFRGYKYPEHWGEDQCAWYDILMQYMPEDEPRILYGKMAEVLNHYTGEGEVQ